MRAVLRWLVALPLNVLRWLLALPLYIFRWAGQPLFHIALRLYAPPDDWIEVPVRAAPWRFGRASRKPFSWYFEGDSAVEVSSIEDIVRWLAECDFATDMELFQESDFWQHPRTLEKLRQGDCDDFALWGWRKLNEIGVPARFFVGRRLSGSEPKYMGHAWVVFEGPSGQMVLETADRPLEHPLRPLEEVRHEYCPHFSVDASYRTRFHAGWWTSARDDLKRRNPAEALARALRAKGASEDIVREVLTPDDRWGGWGLSNKSLAFAVVSPDFYEYLKARPLSPAERKALESIRLLPQDQAVAELEAGRWDPPYTE